MKTKVMSILTRTPLHVGCGSSVGAVDQPIVREHHTGYPVIPGSSIKGVLADLWTTKQGEKWIREDDGVKLLGNDPENKGAKAESGALLIGEGKLVAFPVRSAKGCWAWLTCPLVLARLARDWPVTKEGAEAKSPSFDQPNEGEALAGSALIIADGGDKAAVLEEYPLKVVDEVPSKIVEWLKPLSADPVWVDNLAGHLAIVSDDLFAYFAKNACEIANHNRINDETGVVEDGALFSQENVPSETMFYAPISCMDKVPDGLAKLETKVKGQDNKLQIGADATTGLGWCSVSFK